MTGESWAVGSLAVRPRMRIDFAHYTIIEADGHTVIITIIEADAIVPKLNTVADIPIAPERFPHRPPHLVLTLAMQLPGHVAKVVEPWDGVFRGTLWLADGADEPQQAAPGDDKHRRGHGYG